MVDDPDFVPAAYDGGINFFFLSTDLHWSLYEGMRRGLGKLLERGGGIRDRIVVAAASYVGAPLFMAPAFDELLDALPILERIDVCLAGGCYEADHPGRPETMVRMRDRGLAGCRAAGGTFHDRTMLLPAHNDATLDITLLRYNTLHSGARTDVFPAVEPSPTLLFGFKSMAWQAAAHDVALPPGTWVPDPVDHYRFVLSSTALDGILCAPQSARELRELSDAMDRGPLDQDEQEHMIDLSLLLAGRAELLPPSQPPNH